MWTAVEEKNMEAIDPCSYEHYLSSSKNKAWKSSGPYEIWVKISAQPHPTLCIQFLNRENNDKNNTFPLGKQICFTIVWGCAETLPRFEPMTSTGADGMVYLEPT